MLTVEQDQGGVEGPLHDTLDEKSESYKLPEADIASLPRNYIALIFADQLTIGEDRLAATLVVAGRSLIERQLMQLKRRGIEEAVVIAGAYDDHGSLQQFRKRSKHLPNVTIVGRDFVGALSKSHADAYLMMEGHALIDDRIFDALTARSGPDFVAVKIDTETDAQTVCIKWPANHQIDGATFQTLSAEAQSAATTLNITDLPLYIPNRRRDVPYLFHRVVDHAACKARSFDVIRQGQKGTLDWPARWLHPVPENWLVYLLSHTRISPNGITLLTSGLGFYATYLLGIGSFLAALVLILSVGVFDGVDGKLARAKMQETAIGELEHLVDKLVEYSWYFALAWYFSASYGSAVWGLALLTAGFAWAETVQGEFYRRLTGCQLDDAGEFEKAWRLVSGRRNTFMYSFLPFTLTGYAYEGFWMIAIYSFITFFVAQISFIVRLRMYSEKNSKRMAKNLADTAYF